jgi:hypothetical protein
MKVYRYQELKLQTRLWVPQEYRDYLWQVTVKEELSDEGKYAAHGDLELAETLATMALFLFISIGMSRETFLPILRALRVFVVQDRRTTSNA